MQYQYSFNLLVILYDQWITWSLINYGFCQEVTDLFYKIGKQEMTKEVKDPYSEIKLREDTASVL